MYPKQVYSVGLEPTLLPIASDALPTELRVQIYFNQSPKTFDAVLLQSLQRTELWYSSDTLNWYITLLSFSTDIPTKHDLLG